MGFVSCNYYKATEINWIALSVNVRFLKKTRTE